MYVIASAVHFDKFNIEISAHTSKVAVELGYGILIEYFSPVFGDKHQVDVHQENTVSTKANISFIFHRPKYNNPYETTSSF